MTVIYVLDGEKNFVTTVMKTKISLYVCQDV